MSAEITPVISVIMGIYNCEATLGDAIESILNQTFQNFELILCDDGSTDRTLDIAKEYKEKYPCKLVLLVNKRNRGLNYTLNRCLSVAKGKYIARMDGDDISLPERFEHQVNFLENHTNISIVGTSMNVFDEKGIWGKHEYKLRPEKKDFLKGTPFAHPTCMVRKQAYLEVDGYTDSKKLLRVEDYHLWVKMYSRGYLGANLTEVLYLYRDDRNGYSKRKFRYRLNESYVMLWAINMLHLPVYGLLYALRPICVGLLPYSLYNLLHKWKWRKE